MPVSIDVGHKDRLLMKKHFLNIQLELLQADKYPQQGLVTGIVLFRKWGFRHGNAPRNYERKASVNNIKEILLKK